MWVYEETTKTDRTGEHLRVQGAVDSNLPETEALNSCLVERWVDKDDPFPELADVSHRVDHHLKCFSGMKAVG